MRRWALGLAGPRNRCGKALAAHPSRLAHDGDEFAAVAVPRERLRTTGIVPQAAAKFLAEPGPHPRVDLTHRVTAGRNREWRTQRFCRLLAATPTHRYALTPDLFPVQPRKAAEIEVSRTHNSWVLSPGRWLALDCGDCDNFSRVLFTSDWKPDR